MNGYYEGGAIEHGQRLAERDEAARHYIAETQPKIETATVAELERMLSGSDGFGITAPYAPGSRRVEELCNPR